jgi:hypothetical protein
MSFQVPRYVADVQDEFWEIWNNKAAWRNCRLLNYWCASVSSCGGFYVTGFVHRVKQESTGCA